MNKQTTDKAVFMGILNIREAKRSGSKVVIGLAGQSGSGKTLTALYIARGMVEHPGQIGFLDTENRRGSLYSDELGGPFMIGDLYPPFSPQRYSAAIKEFQAAGVKVLIIDSVTHEWEGEGGCIDIAETGARMANWKLAKSEHKKFMNTLLQSDMHIIACVRAREQTDFTNPKEPRSLGVQPVCEKNFMFEMTASVLMLNEGTQQTHLKVPKELKPVFGSGEGYIGHNVGRGIINWVNSGEAVDPEIKKWETLLQQATSGGLKELGETWSRVPKHLQASLAAHKDQCKHAAQAYDEAEKPTEDDSDDLGAFVPAIPEKPTLSPELPAKQEPEKTEPKGIEDF